MPLTFSGTRRNKNDSPLSLAKMRKSELDGVDEREEVDLHDFLPVSPGSGANERATEKRVSARASNRVQTRLARMDSHIDVSDATKWLEDTRVENNAVEGPKLADRLLDGTLRDGAVSNIALDDDEGVGVLLLECLECWRKRPRDGDDVGRLGEEDLERGEAKAAGGAGEKNGLGHDDGGGCGPGSDAMTRWREEEDVKGLRRSARSRRSLLHRLSLSSQSPSTRSR